MRYPDLSALLDRKRAELGRGPLSIVLAEDEVELQSTLDHQLACGFRDVVLLAPEGVQVAPEIETRLHIVTHDVFAEGALVQAVNAVVARLPGTWLHYCHNAEYLFFPFCETRRVRELLTFHTEERREAMLTYVIDLYAGDLGQHANGVALDDAWLDRKGYYALARKDPANGLAAEGPAAGFLRRPALAVRRARPLRPPPDRPHLAVPRQAGGHSLARLHALG